MLAPLVELEVVSLAHDDAELQEAGRLRALGARVTACRTSRARNSLHAIRDLAGTRPLTHSLLDAPGLKSTFAEIVQNRPPDVVLAFCSGMARFALEAPLDQYPLVLDMVDVDSEKWRVLAERENPVKGWIYRREARCLSAFERIATRRAFATLVVNERERTLLEALAPGARIRTSGNGVDLRALTPAGPPGNASAVVFCGVMNYEPNVQGVLWFARDVWPRIRASAPEASFVIVGSNPTDAIRNLAGTNGVEVTGSVPDVRSFLWEAAVAVAPLHAARGVQNKVLEAIAAGLPTVMTPQVHEGVPDVAHVACVVADSAETFARGVTALLKRTPGERRALAHSADLSSLEWERQLMELPSLLRQAAERRRAASAAPSSQTGA
jgi:sugar transferase (PEP-CTERM/EpsH1 system associated)